MNQENMNQEKEYSIEFNQDDLNTLHDVIFNALGKEDLTNEQVMEYWNMFPENIKLDALKWGVSDTPTRENMHVWLQENSPIITQANRRLG